MKVAEGSEGLDVVGLVEQQPALLLQAGARVSSDETAAERLQVRAPVGLRAASAVAEQGARRWVSGGSMGGRGPALALASQQQAAV